MAIMGLMIDLTVVLSAENTFCFTGCEFLYEALWSMEKKRFIFAEYFVYSSYSLQLLNHYD